MRADCIRSNPQVSPEIMTSHLVSSFHTPLSSYFDIIHTSISATSTRMSLFKGEIYKLGAVDIVCPSYYTVLYETRFNVFLGFVILMSSLTRDQDPHNIDASIALTTFSSSVFNLNCPSPTKPHTATRFQARSRFQTYSHSAPPFSRYI